MKTLKSLRKRIDEIDGQILELLNKRAKTTVAIAQVKKEKGMEYYLPHREEELYKSLRTTNKGPFPNNAREEVYRENISGILFLQASVAKAHTCSD